VSLDRAPAAVQSRRERVASKVRVVGWLRSHPAGAVALPPVRSAQPIQPFQETPIVRKLTLSAINVPYTATSRNALAHTPASWIIARRRAAPRVTRDTLPRIGIPRLRNWPIVAKERSI